MFNNISPVRYLISINLYTTYVAQSITCYQCPYGILPNEKCLNDGEDTGKEHNCLNPLDNACETLIIGKFDIIYENVDR